MASPQRTPHAVGSSSELSSLGGGASPVTPRLTGVRYCCTDEHFSCKPCDGWWPLGSVVRAARRNPGPAPRSSAPSACWARCVSRRSHSLCRHCLAVPRPTLPCAPRYASKMYSRSLLDRITCVIRVAGLIHGARQGRVHPAPTSRHQGSPAPPPHQLVVVARQNNVLVAILGGAGRGGRGPCCEGAPGSSSPLLWCSCCEPRQLGHGLPACCSVSL